MAIKRYLQSDIETWLTQRFVFIGGPRQVGKTFLSKNFLKSKNDYLSWDDLSDRELLRKHQLPLTPNPIVIDEIHKYPRWRTLLKGYFDKNDPKPQIIVTGSARLDHFRKGGDSLFGRYHYLRLHPFSIGEIDSKFKMDTVRSLLKFGGFPEPFLKQNDSFLKIWRKQRIARVFHDDLRDLTRLNDYNQIEMLASVLPAKVGSLLSLNSLGEDLEKSPHTIANWINILSQIYHCYLVPPYGPAKIKAIKKQQKLYLWDWSAIEELGPRFENMVASHLLKYCHHKEDRDGDDMELRFLRDQFGREIDFVVLKNKKPIFAVECKTGEKRVSPHLSYFKSRTPIGAYYQVHMGERSFIEHGIEVLPFSTFCEKVLGGL
jgi:predicted AAA+ superfamily ATPase